MEKTILEITQEDIIEYEFMLDLTILSTENKLILLGRLEEIKHDILENLY